MANSEDRNFISREDALEVLKIASNLANAVLSDEQKGDPSNIEPVLTYCTQLTLARLAVLTGQDYLVDVWVDV